ncbi:hypothetical protein [Burkholderia vietnamiensis]|nr:hypothetical protein [Burkholderia vietnamiensis]
MAKFNALAAAADLPDPKDQRVSITEDHCVECPLNAAGAEQPGCLIKP